MSEICKINFTYRHHNFNSSYRNNLSHKTHVVSPALYDYRGWGGQICRGRIYGNTLYRDGSDYTAQRATITCLAEPDNVFICNSISDENGDYDIRGLDMSRTYRLIFSYDTYESVIKENITPEIV
jgi:hypothetical protein